MEKILVIEDDKDIADFMEIVLCERYIVLAKRNASNVTEELTRFNPQLIIIDNQVGQRCAPDIMDEIRAIDGFSQIPCILFSAHHNIEKIAHKIKATAFIAKPFDLLDLYECIEKALPPRQFHIINPKNNDNHAAQIN